MSSFCLSRTHLPHAAACGQVLHAPPLGMSPGEVSKLRAACDAEAKKPDAEMRAFLARLGLGGQLVAALEAFGVAKVDDLLDPRVVSDADLADLGLASDQVARFRAAAQHAEQQRAHAAHGPGGGGGGPPGGRLILRLAGPDGFGGEDDEEGLQTMEGFFTLRNDVIVDAHAQLGEGRHKRFGESLTRRFATLCFPLFFSFFLCALWTAL